MERHQIIAFKQIAITIKAYKKKRSLDANSYFHVLVGKIADATGNSKVYIKNKLIAEYGQYESSCRIRVNGGGHLHQTARLVIMMTPLFGVFLRPVTSAALATATVAGCAHFVSFPLRFLNIKSDQHGFIYRKIDERGDIVTRQEQEDKEQEEYLAEWLRKKKEKKKKFIFRRNKSGRSNKSL